MEKTDEDEHCYCLYNIQKGKPQWNGTVRNKPPIKIKIVKTEIFLLKKEDKGAYPYGEIGKQVR